MTKYVGAIDQGTTSTRFIVFIIQARLSLAIKKNMSKYIPNLDGLSTTHRDMGEHQACHSKCFTQIQSGGWDLSAIGITNQRETTVIWTKPLANHFPMLSCGRTLELMSSVML